MLREKNEVGAEREAEMRKAKRKREREETARS